MFCKNHAEKVNELSQAGTELSIVQQSQKTIYLKSKNLSLEI